MGSRRGRKARRTLSPRGRQILDFIATFLEARGYAPSVRQIKEGCGLSTTSLVHYHLCRLEALGYIRRVPGVARAVAPASGYRRRRATRTAIRLVGVLTAGHPRPMPPTGNGTSPWPGIIVLPASLVGGRRRLYAVRVRGFSMPEALVADGDVIVMESPPATCNGDVVALWHRRQARYTIARLYTDSSRLRMHSLDEAAPPSYTEAEDVEILGRVVAVLRVVA